MIRHRNERSRPPIASSYIDHGKCALGLETEDTLNWVDFTHKRLWWLYGPERALAISCGRDPATIVDVERWKRLGRILRSVGRA